MTIDSAMTRLVQRKVCLLGDFAVGKTSLVRRFVEGRFDDRYFSTIGVKISRKVVMYDQRPYNLLIWDLADGETYRTGDAYLRGAAGALVVCDLTRRQSLPSLIDYMTHIRQVNPGVAAVMVANKSDLAAQQAIELAELQTLSGELAAPWVMTSAKTGAGVEYAFITLVQLIEAKA